MTCLLALAVLSCSGGNTHHSSLLEGVERQDIRADCKRAAVKCTQCHPAERIIHAGPDSPQHWQRYVKRMRLMPGSNINTHDAKRIERCLIYRSFGEEGLESLRTGGRR